jgi:hypothetical protein
MPLCGPERSACSFRSVDTLVRVTGSGVSGDPWRIETYDGDATESPDTRPALADRFLNMKIWTTDTDRLFRWDGTVWRILHEPPQIYTPVLTNINVGNGLSRWASRRRDREVFVVGHLKLGTTGASVTGAISVALPYTADVTVRRQVGVAYITQAAGPTNFPSTADINLASATVMSLYFSDGAFAISSTNPIVWTANDEINVAIRYWTA